jgi:hypothetical protein
LGVPFKTPEQLFLGQTNEEPYKLEVFNAVEYLAMEKERFEPGMSYFRKD